MRPAGHKRGSGQPGHGGPPSDDSIEFVRETKRAPITSRRVLKRVKLEEDSPWTRTAARQPRRPQPSPTQGWPADLTTTDKRLAELRSMTESSEQAVAEIKEKHEEWKEEVVSRVQKANKEDKVSIEAQVHKIETKVDDFIHKSQYEVGELGRKCLSLVESRFEEFSEQLKNSCRDRATYEDRVTVPTPVPRHDRTARTATQNSARRTVNLGTPRISTVPSSRDRTVMSDFGDLPSANQIAATAFTGSSIDTIDKQIQDAYTKLPLGPDSYTIEPHITAHGYQQMISNVDFTNVDMLEALSRVDHVRHQRDYTLFYDISHPTMTVHYIVRIGGSAWNIMDKAPAVRYKHHSELQHMDLDPLRIFELIISDSELTRAEHEQFEQWKSQNDVPRYVYELGAVFLRREYKSSLREDVVSTCFSLVMDITQLKRPIWIILRPGLDPRSRKVPKNRRDSTLPFDGMDNAVMACVRADGRKFEVASGSYLPGSYRAYQAAEALVNETACKAPVEFYTQAADLGVMLKVIGKGH